MRLMGWSSHFETGLPLVDQLHRGLVDKLNTAAPLLGPGSTLTPGDAPPLLEQLTRYAAVHFKTEDDLMQAAGVDLRHLAHHRGAHGGFVAQLTALRTEFEKGDGIQGEGLLRFLVAWLTFHILGEDQAMARQITAIQNGKTPALAYDDEDSRGPRDPAQAALVDALVDLFNLVSTQNKALSDTNTRIGLYRDHLEDLVAARSTELEKANQALQKPLAATAAASQAKSRFLRTVSHELLTPLNAVLGFSHLLQDAHLPEKAQEQAGRIQDAARSLNGKLHGLITYATLDAGGVEEKRVPFEIPVLFAHLVSRFNARAEEKGLALVEEIDADLPPLLLGDAPHIELALSQLLRNALGFTNSGQVVLRASQAFASLSASARAALGTHQVTLAAQLAHFDFSAAVATLDKAKPPCP